MNEGQLQSPAGGQQAQLSSPLHSSGLQPPTANACATGHGHSAQQQQQQQQPPGTPMGIGDFVGEGSGGKGGVHPLERPELPLEIKAALFAQLLAEAEGIGKKVCAGGGKRRTPVEWRTRRSLTVIW